MTNVLDQAQNVNGLVSAARFRDRMALREAKATDDGDRRMYREARFDVEQRFPELAELPVGGAEGLARERGHGQKSRSPVHEGRRRSGGSSRPKAKEPIVKPGATGRGPDRKPIPGVDPTARRSSGSKTTSSRRGKTSTPKVDRAIAQTGIPAAAGSTGSMVMSALGATVGVSLVYLVFSSSERKGSGARAVPSVVDGTVKALGRFLGPGDVFTDNKAAAAPSSPPANAPIQGHGRRAPARLPRATRPHQFNNR